MKHPLLTLILVLLSLAAIALAVDAPVDKYVRVDAVLADAVPNVATVRPSGDKTGKTDAAAIQSAITSMMAVEGGVGLVQLVPGMYYLDTPLVIGSLTDNQVPGCSLGGQGVAYISYVGPLTDRYAISVCGANTMFPAPRVSSIYLSCNQKSRGILMLRQTYRGVLENVGIVGSRGVGLDWVSSWTATARNIRLYFCQGIALRVWRSQNCVFDSLAITKCTGDEWPAADDSTIQDDTGAFVQTADKERGLIVINTQHTTFRSMLMEANDAGDLPLIYAGLSCVGITFNENVYMEGNNCPRQAVLVSGWSSPIAATGHIAFENVLNENKPGECFIRLTGYTSAVTVNGIRGSIPDTLKHIIMADGGKHFATRVIGSRTGIESREQVIPVNGGKLIRTEPYSWDHSLLE